MIKVNTYYRNELMATGEFRKFDDDTRKEILKKIICCLIDRGCPPWGDDNCSAYEQLINIHLGPGDTLEFEVH